MPKFLLKKTQRINSPEIYYWQGDSFLLEAPSVELARRFVGLIDGTPLCGGMLLNLELVEAYEGELPALSLYTCLRLNVRKVAANLGPGDLREFNRLWAKVKGEEGLDAAIAYFLKCKAPELLETVFKKSPE